MQAALIRAKTMPHLDKFLGKDIPQGELKSKLKGALSGLKVHSGSKHGRK